uniref:Ig-like domain-containing protein n=1 Tax=Fundulus heteroclitus TaxID=8078 RepID=A0A3Q2PYV8_FUNHE
MLVKSVGIPCLFNALISLFLTKIDDPRLPPVQLGESVTFECALPQNERQVYWYKQRPGDSLRLILTVMVTQNKPKTPKFEPEFSDSRWKVNNDQDFSRLTLLQTTYDDDGVYHCALLAWTRGIEWSGTYLIVIADTRGFEFTTLVTVATCLVFSLILNIVLISYRAPRANKNQSNGKYYKNIIFFICFMYRKH